MMGEDSKVVILSILIQKGKKRVCTKKISNFEVMRGELKDFQNECSLALLIGS